MTDMYVAGDLQVGWRVLDYPDNTPIASVSDVDGLVSVQFESGREDAWASDAPVHAESV